MEMQFASLLGAERDDAEFLKGFAQGSGERRFIRIDFSARAVNLARAEAALLRIRRIFPLRTTKRRLARTRGCQLVQSVMSLFCILSGGNEMELMSGGG
jgi:hypothetical protein